MEPKHVTGIDEAIEGSDTTVVFIRVKTSEDLYNFFDSDDIKDTSWAETFKTYTENQPIRSQ